MTPSRRARRVRLVACLALCACSAACPGGRAEVALPTDAPGLLAMLRKSTPFAAAQARSTSALDDPWGRPYLYRAPDRDSPFQSETVAIVSTLGADGVEGGAGENADLAFTERP